MMRDTISCGTATLRLVEDDVVEVLLVQPRAGQDLWGYPKGHCEPGETFAETAIRETLEETGLDVELLNYTLDPVLLDLKKERKTVLITLALPLDQNAHVAPSDGENYKVQWWPVHALPPVFRYQRPMFKQMIDIVGWIF